RREAAPALGADARRVGGAPRGELGGAPGGRSGALQRAVPPHLEHVPVVVRGDGPLQERPHASVPGPGEQGKHRLELSDEPDVPLSRIGTGKPFALSLSKPVLSSVEEGDGALKTVIAYADGKAHLPGDLGGGGWAG